MDKSLVELLQKKQGAPDAGTVVDWDERREKYLAAVHVLYQQIEQIFAEPIEKKAVLLQRRSKQLAESYIGTYSVDDLLISVGNEQVRFSPRGRNVVGATGRVDVIGERGEAVLILQPDSQWVFVQTWQPKLIVLPFSESTLAEVLKLVMRA